MKYPHSLLRLLLLAGLAGALALFAGCSPSSGGSGTRSGESMGQAVARHEQQIQGLLSQVGQVEQVLPGQAEMWSQMQAMRQELNQIHGQLEMRGGGGGDNAAMQDSIRRLQTAVRQMASQLAVNIGELEPPAGTASTPPPAYAPAAPAYTPPPAVAPPPSAAPVEAAQQMYEGGIKAFDQRRYKDAVGIFKDFTANYPSHSLSSNAHFWEGESYYQMQDYGRAVLAYQEVIDKYQSSQKYQAAMLKQGLALHNVGKKDAGKQRLNELVKRYPNSPEASRAKQFLAQNK